MIQCHKENSMNQDEFRSKVEEAIKPFTEELVNKIVGSKEILETKFPPQIPMKERSDIFNLMIKNSLAPLMNTLNAIDLEKIKSELEQRFKEGVYDQSKEEQNL